MALETADFINELDENNPTFNDPVGRGDDHARLIKHVLKSTFPNFDGPIDLSDDEINELPEDIQNRLDFFFAVIRPHLMPAGIILMWSGNINSIPDGWQLCDGSNGTPDLRNRFIVGAGASYNVGNNGGSNTKNTSNDGNHDHGGTQGHSLTIGQIPAHGHDLVISRRSISGGATGGALPNSSLLTAARNFNFDTGRLGGTNVSNTGGGNSHSHGISNSGNHRHSVDVRPPYYALAYIQKISEVPEGNTL